MQTYEQSAVIPYCTDTDGIRFLIITSRKRKRWVIPKGLIEPDLSATESAAKEALEEAGVTGAVYAAKLGTYTYAKWRGVCRVQVFAMRVDAVQDDWEEAGLRDRLWLSPAEAAARMREPELKTMMLKLAEQLNRGEK